MNVSRNEFIKRESQKGKVPNPNERPTEHDPLFWPDVKEGENQSKFIRERINQVEKYFGDLCENFGAYTRKTASLRDKGDILGRSVLEYAAKESHNHTTKAALKDFSDHLTVVQDLRDIEVKRLETRVCDPLSTYGHQCRITKDRLRQAFAARDREMKTKKKYDTAREKHPTDTITITEAETDLHQASADASRSSKVLEEEIDNFEKKKLQDIKQILLDFVNVELMFHAKALEMYTRCYQSLTTMSEEEDLEEFRNSLRPSTFQQRTTLQQQKMGMVGGGSLKSLNDTGRSINDSNVDGQPISSVGTPASIRKPQAAPIPALRTQARKESKDNVLITTPIKGQQVLESSQDDDDEEEDDDDDDEEDDDDETDDEDDDDDDDDEISELTESEQEVQRPHVSKREPPSRSMVPPPSRPGTNAREKSPGPTKYSMFQAR